MKNVPGNCGVHLEIIIIKKNPNAVTMAKSFVKIDLILKV